MNEKISAILAQMASLEDELRTAVAAQESQMFFVIKGKRVEFEASVKAAHRKMKTNFFRWLVTNRPQNLITGPIIYGVVKVRRSDYIVFDRRHLGYLNFIEKFHCTYCEYGNGLMSYMAEILARTEEIFLPYQARPQGIGHAYPLQPVSGLWRRRRLRSQIGGLPRCTGQEQASA